MSFETGITFKTLWLFELNELLRIPDKEENSTTALVAGGINVLRIPEEDACWVVKIEFEIGCWHPPEIIELLWIPDEEGKGMHSTMAGVEKTDGFKTVA